MHLRTEVMPTPRSCLGPTARRHTREAVLGIISLTALASHRRSQLGSTVRQRKQSLSPGSAPAVPLRMPFKSHSEYFAAQPAALAARLEQVQRVVEAKVPDAVRTVSHNMPAFKIVRTFFYFAAFKNHIGVFPPVTTDASVVAASAPYRGPNGNLSFPHAQELPLALIGRVAEALASQYRVI